MRSGHLMVGIFLVTITAGAYAQAPECSNYFGNAQRVCSAAVDGSRAFHPVFGMLVSGGNPTIGTAATLGGLGHGSMTIRANAVNLTLPDVKYNGSSSTVPAADELFVPAPMVEGSLGLFKGTTGGLMAVDFLASAQLLPTTQIEHLSVDQKARRIGSIAVGLGYGARVGLLRGLGPVPDVSVSVMRRDIPRITYGDVAGGDEYSYGVEMHSTNLRLIASKQVAILDLAAGVGWDNYTGNAIIQFRDPITSTLQPNGQVDLDNSRVLGFVNAGFSMGMVRLTGELGYQGAKDHDLSTDFENLDTTKGKLFAGLGLRVSF